MICEAVTAEEGRRIDPSSLDEIEVALAHLRAAARLTRAFRPVAAYREIETAGGILRAVLDSARVGRGP